MHPATSATADLARQPVPADSPVRALSEPTALELTLRAMRDGKVDVLIDRRNNEDIPWRRVG